MKLYDDQLIVITGAAGFIGSGLVKWLNDQGVDNLLLVDRLGDDCRWKNLVGKRFFDLIDPDALMKWLDGREDRVEAFIHLGACTDTLETNLNYLMENNYRYSLRLVEYAIHNNHRFIYASSAATYGDGTHGFSDQLDDILSLRPLNPYAFSKQLFDQWVLQQGLMDRVLGIKYFNVYGPNEWHKGRMASPIQGMVRSARSGNPISLFTSNHPDYADGEQVRDFIYVKDAVRMTYDLFRSDATGLFNVGTGIPTTWRSVAEAVFAACDLPPSINYVPMPEELKQQYQYYTCADMEHTKSVIGSSVKCVSIGEGVNDYIKNYLIPQKIW